MTQRSLLYPLKFTLGLLVLVSVPLLFTNCGSLVRVEYQHPPYGGGAVEFTLPQKKEGYAK